MKVGTIQPVLLLALVLFLDPQPSPAGVVCTWPQGFSGNCDATLAQGTNGALYGTTVGIGEGFGVTASAGTIFEASTTRSTFIGVPPGYFSNIVSFSTRSGGAPNCGVTLAPDQSIYASGALYGKSNSLFSAGMGAFFHFGPRTGNTYLLGSDQDTEGHPLDGANPRSPLLLGADNDVYGTTYEGGSNGYADGALGFGTVFKIDTNMSSLVKLHSFAGTDGANPGVLTMGADGNLYGVTAFGGASTAVVETNGKTGYGALFKITTNGTFTLLYSFGTSINAAGGALDGSQPNALFQAADGSFCGTTAFGGSNLTITTTRGDVGYGTFFHLDTNGVLTTLYSFGAATNAHGFPLDGGEPTGPLLQGRDGNFFGVTHIGGPTNTGTVFRITPQGTLTTLLALGTNASIHVILPPPIFTPTGTYPVGGLLLGADGWLYGTTFSGGPFATDAGAVFRLGPPAPQFASPPPLIQLVLAGSTNTLAVTVNTIYDPTLQWQFNGTNLTDGGNISGSRTASLTVAGVLRPQGGQYSLLASNIAGHSNVFCVMDVVPALITKQPVPETIPSGATNSFSVAVQSVLPYVCQWRLNGTNLADGGSISGSATTNLTVSGATVSNTGFYSVMISNAAGTVSSADAPLNVQPFLTDLAPTNLTIFAGQTATLASAFQSVDPLHYEWTFNGALLDDGANITGSTSNILSISNADIAESGTYTLTVSNAAGQESWSVLVTVFPRVASGWIVTTVHQFTNASDGGYPNGLVAGSDGALYGAARSGGLNTLSDGGGNGLIFRLTTNGVLQTLYSFLDGSDQANPSGPLVQSSNGIFYGTTASSIGGQYGTVFAATTNGALTTLATFNGADGSSPQAVAIGPDGNLYGAYGADDPYIAGVFRVNPLDETLATAYFFSGTNGTDPASQLTLGRDGRLYGCTTFPASTIFAMDTNGVLTTLYDFTNIDDGAVPNGGLLPAPDGAWYGTTELGGAYGEGTVFKFTTNGALTTLYSFGAETNSAGTPIGGTIPIAGLTFGPDGWLYGTTDTEGFENNGTVFRISTNGNFMTIAWLNESTGFAPSQPLTVGADGNLYGATIGGTNGFGAIFEVILPSETPTLAAIQQSGGSVQFTATAVTGKWYQVQYTQTLDQPSWQNFGPLIQASSPSIPFSDVIGQTQRFYRVVLVNQ